MHLSPHICMSLEYLSNMNYVARSQADLFMHSVLLQQIMWQWELQINIMNLTGNWDFKKRGPALLLCVLSWTENVLRASYSVITSLFIHSRMGSAIQRCGVLITEQFKPAHTHPLSCSARTDLCTQVGFIQCVYCNTASYNTVTRPPAKLATLFFSLRTCLPN